VFIRAPAYRPAAITGNRPDLTNRVKGGYSNGRMKPAPAPAVEGNTPWERLDHAFRTVIGVSKDELLKRESKLARAKRRKRAKPG
jgi:hypothetical protein